MSTGISMSSVNKIKELANNGDYSLALDILEHQDLSKSLSPQFIRICGEVYYENGLYTEARAALVRAHSMAPAGNKIIYSLIKLYLSMGLRQLAEHYFEIYKFNQDKKDAGTYRIEYMIAKAYHKPVNELYSILVSANDMETSEVWDYEMLLLHAYIRNKSKFDSAAVEFKARYRNSSRLSTLDDLTGDKVDLESMVYVFPCEDKKDDAPEQETVREQEKKILEDDDLKIHPKDAKIMIMVEDDTPVSSTMKFKQMWIRSKDKKEQKREQKREESESSDKKDKKKSRGLWGIMSKKEEELVDQEMQEIQSEEIDKEKLLDEVVSGASDDSGDMKISEAESGEGAASNDPGAEVSENMTEESAEGNPDDEAKISGDDQDDSFVIEEEPEDVVMVDADFLSDSDDESDTDGYSNAQNKEAEETFDPEFADEDTSFIADDDYGSLDEIQIKNESFDSEIYLDEGLSDTSEDHETLKENKNSEESETAEESEITEKSEASEESEITEKSEASEESEVIEESGISEESESIEDRENSEESESIEESGISEESESIEDRENSEESESIEEREVSEEGEALEESNNSEESEFSEGEKNWDNSEELDALDDKEQQEQEKEKNSKESDIFDFDKAFESLEEFDIDEDENIEFDMEVQDDMLSDEDIPESDIEDMDNVNIEEISNEDIENEITEDISEENLYENSSGTSEKSPEVIAEESEKETVEVAAEETQESVSQPESDVKNVSEHEFDVKDVEDASKHESVTDDIDDNENIYDIKDIDDISESGSSLEDFEDIFEMKDNDDVIDIDSMDDISADDNKADNKKDVFEENQPEHTKHMDFPVFKSSLFPDYNTEGAKMYDVKENKIANIETEERKISENLQKEEDLIGETDRLLARLGIKLETEFKSILNFDDADEASADDVDRDNDIALDEHEVGGEESNTSADSEDKTENSENDKPEKESKKKKKSFKLKG